MSAARPVPLPLLTALALAAARFAIYVYPAHAQEGSAPDKPRGLEAAATPGQVTLTWNAPNDDSITGYFILRRNRQTNPKGQFTPLIADTGTAATTHTDDSAGAGATYTYRIKATNEPGVSERSPWFHIDTPADPAPEPANSAATGVPTISGTAQVGEILTTKTTGIADEDGLEMVTFTYQWLADDTAIKGATGSSHTLAAADEGKAIKIRESFTRYQAGTFTVSIQVTQ